MRRIDNPTEYFLNHFKPDPDGCWFWTGSIAVTGYGIFTSAGKTKAAHRFSYNHFKGEIPTGLHIDHLCRNRACVRPDHLEPVTLEENIKRGYAARFGNRTHCVNGHELSEQNFFFNKLGHKSCLTCKRIHQLTAQETKIQRKLDKYGAVCPFCKGTERKLTNHMGHHTKPVTELKPQPKGNTNLTCHYCGCLFTGYERNHTRKYCSLKCAYASPDRVVNRKTSPAWGWLVEKKDGAA